MRHRFSEWLDDFIDGFTGPLLVIVAAICLVSMFSGECRVRYESRPVGETHAR